MKQPDKKMKLWKKIVLGVVAGLLVLIIAFTIWQWENIKALYIFATYSSDEIEQMANDAYEKKEEVLGQYDGVTVRDITPEQEKQLMNGEMTVEEAVAIIEESDNSSGDATDANTEKGGETPKPQQQGKGEASKPNKTPGQTQPQTQPVSKETEIVNKYLKEIYTLKAQFLGNLANLKSEAQAEFYKFPLPERTVANKRAVITDRAIECYELENQCDMAINDLLDRLEAELDAIDADTQIVDDIRSAYKEEKSVKKAYYINLANAGF